MYKFNYYRAASLEDAAAKLNEDSESVILAGGQTLIPTLKQRLAAPSTVIDISHLRELAAIWVADEVLIIGATARHFDVAESAVVKNAIPGLAELAANIGDPHVRHRGTIGGSIANNDPAADYTSACLALDAIIRTDRREINAQEFFVGLFETALEQGEIVVSICFKIPQKMAYKKFPNPASRYALVGTCVASTVDGPRVAITGAGLDGVFRWKESELALRSFEAEALTGIEVDAGTLISDMHGPADYRASLIHEMTRRAIAAANEYYQNQ